MSVLALDTSTRNVTVAARVNADGTVLDATRESEAATITLGRAVARMLDDSVDAVVVVQGPGSYTGLRAGLAAALGVAVARALPVYGIGTLEVVAAGVPRHITAFHVVADAGRNAFYAATAERNNVQVRVTPARRVDAAAFEAGDRPLYATHPVPFAAAVLIDPATALAASVPLALTRSPLDLHDLHAVHVS